MGLMKFVKGAGNLFGKKGEPPAAEDLAKAVSDNGLEVEGLEVSVEGDKAIIKGKAATQEQREKALLAIGNTEGIAEVEDTIEVAEAAPEAEFHTVESGDTLSKIAKEYYGDAMKYPMIFEANKPMLSDPDKIYPGQVLRIPEETAVA